MEKFPKFSWIGLMIATVVSLPACQSKSETTEKSANLAAASQSSQQTTITTNPAANKAASQTVASAITATNATNVTASVTTSSSSPKAINWALIDSGVKPVDKEKFKYPFALDSVQVKAYMDAYHVDAKTARYNLTTGMVVNEILSKVLDQVGTAYVSHELTAGNDSKFIIHTTSQIAPSEHLYVFEEPYAHGLTMPVKIINDGKK